MTDREVYWLVLAGSLGVLLMRLSSVPEQRDQGDENDYHQRIPITTNGFRADEMESLQRLKERVAAGEVES